MKGALKYEKSYKLTVLDIRFKAVKSMSRLKTNKYIRCNVPGFQFDKSKLVKYVAAYKTLIYLNLQTEVICLRL